MAQTSDCPAALELRRFQLGQLPEAEAEQVQRHLSRCPACLDNLHTSKVEDPLVAALRSQTQVVAGPEDDVVEKLIHQLTSSAVKPSTEVTDGDDTSDVVGFLGPAQAADEIGRLGTYRVQRVLGTGGMGVVFEAEDSQLKRRVALKVMKPKLAASAVERQRFLREAQAAAAIEHDNIIPIHQVGEDRDVPFLAMPLLRGEALEARLRRSAPLPLQDILRIARETAEGLAAAHDRSLTHRDIKPANLWLEANEETPAGNSSLHSSFRRVKILDFGLARPLTDDAHLTQTGVVAGTPQYMAPEQADGRQVDGRCDLFSLGCVLYRMSTGQLPFRGPNVFAVLRSLAVAQPAPPRSLNPAVPPALSDLAMKLLAKDPQDRPQTARAVVQAIRAIERGESIPARSQRRRWLPAAAAAVLLLAALLAWLGPAAVSRFTTNPTQVDASVAVTKHTVDTNLDVPTTPPEPVVADEELPFVILAAGGKGPRRHPNLAAAVAAAASGDVIEIHSSQTLFSGSITIVDKKLTIRAGVGFWPKLQVDPESRYPRLLTTNAPLVLEGLEIQRYPGREPLSRGPVIYCEGSPLYVANCRFLLRRCPGTYALHLAKTSTGQIRNCQFTCGPQQYAGLWHCPSVGSLLLANNVLVFEKSDGPGWTIDCREPVQNISFQMTGNTLWNGRRFPSLLIGPSNLEGTRIRVDARTNVFDQDTSLLATVIGQGLSPADVQTQLRRAVLWRAQGNAYGRGVSLLTLWDATPPPTGQVEQPPLHCLRSLAQAQQFWGGQDSDSLEGEIAFQAGSIEEKLTRKFSSVMPADLRLVAGSTGSTAGANGRDVGAEVDLVGPYPAYPRWQKTPAYQQWLKDTGQVK